MTGRGKWIFVLCLVAVTLVGMVALWRSTPYGMGLVNDSATYVEGATRLLEGKGYVRISGGGEIKPITHFPPLFSITLAGIGLAGLDLLQGARALIILLFGVDILLLGLSIFRISRSWGFAVFGALLLALSDLHLGVYSFALSEPLFLTLMLAAFLSLSWSVENSNWQWSALTGFLLGLAFLTRYAGLSLMVTVALVMIYLKPAKWIKRAGIMLTGVLLPIAAWMTYSLVSGGAGLSGNRQLLWHPLPMSTYIEAFKNLLTWIAPNDLLAAGAVWGRGLSLLSLALLPCLFVWLAWVMWHRARFIKHPEKPDWNFTLAFTQACHIPVYLAFMVISLTFFDASTPLDDRILSVVYIPEMILFCSALAWCWNKLKSRAVVYRLVLGLFCLILLAFSVKDGYVAVKQLGREGQGFAHRGLSGSAAIQAIRQMQPTMMYSNKPGAVFLLTRKSAYITPTPIDPVTGQTRANFNEELLLMQQRVRDGQAVLVVFGLRNSDTADEKALFDTLSDELSPLADYGDIIIYGNTR